MRWPFALPAGPGATQAAGKRPNILVIWGDDVGYWNISAPNIETADHEGMDYERWRVEHLFVLVPAQEFVGRFLGTFKEFPPSQKPGSFGVDQVLESLQRGAQGGGG